ncbi:MAG: hypothetical protein V3T05_03735 [Myxococcota bacterium]
MWRRDITPQEYNRTLRLFDVEIAEQTGGVQAGQLQQLMVQQHGMVIRTADLRQRFVSTPPSTRKTPRRCHQRALASGPFCD